MEIVLFFLCLSGEKPYNHEPLLNKFGNICFSLVTGDCQLVARQSPDLCASCCCEDFLNKSNLIELNDNVDTLSGK